MEMSRSFSPRPVVVVAGGPSVTLKDIRTIGMARAQDRCRVLAINDAVYPCWFADHVHACDRKWWIEHKGLPHFFGLKTSVESTRYPDVSQLVSTGISGFDKVPGCIRTGMNSGYQAVHILAQAGVEKIILLGVDFTNDGAREHWFGLHPPGLDKNSSVGDWRHLFRELADELTKTGVQIFNAGERSTLTWLPRFKIETLLKT